MHRLYVPALVILSLLALVSASATPLNASPVRGAPPRAASAPTQNCGSVFRGMVSWWQANWNANDFCGLNNGTLHGGAIFQTGVIGQAFSFDGSSGYVEVPDSDSLHIEGQITVEAWVYPVDVPSNNHGIITKLDNAYNGNFQMEFSDALQSVGWTIADPQGHYTRIWAPDGSVPYNTWTYVVGTTDGSTTKLYVNGSLSASGTPPALSANTFTLLLGAFQRNGFKEGFYAGRIDEAQVYNRALSASEIQIYYASRSGGRH